MRSCATTLFRYTLFAYSGILMLSGLMIIIASVITFSNIYKYHSFYDEGILSLQLLSAVTGLLTIGIAIYGHWGARKEYPKHLKAFTVLLGTFFIIEAGIGIAAVAFESNLAESWRYYYFQKNMEEVIPDEMGAWNSMQMDLMCCGIKELYDWITYSIDQEIPFSCCKDGTECVVNNRENLFQIGCSKKLKNLLNDNLTILMVISLAATCVNIIGMFLSISLVSTLEGSENNNEKQDDDAQEVKDDEAADE